MSTPVKKAKPLRQDLALLLPQERLKKGASKPKPELNPYGRKWCSERFRDSHTVALHISEKHPHLFVRDDVYELSASQGHYISFIIF